MRMIQEINVHYARISLLHRNYVELKMIIMLFNHLYVKMIIDDLAIFISLGLFYYFSVFVLFVLDDNFLLQ